MIGDYPYNWQKRGRNVMSSTFHVSYIRLPPNVKAVYEDDWANAGGNRRSPLYYKGGVSPYNMMGGVRR